MILIKRLLFRIKFGLLQAALCLAICPLLLAEEKLAIFHPSILQPRELEKILSNDPALSDVKVVAFANFDDFQTTLNNESINYAMVPSSYPKYFGDFEAIFQFTVSGKKSFRYQVITLDSTWSKERISEGTAGIINTFGREKTRLFLSEIMINAKFKRIKQVSKVSDLLPLLLLGNANYAVISPLDLAKAKKDFTSQPIVISETREISYPIISVRKGKLSSFAERFKQLDPGTLKLMGFDGIQSVSNNNPKDPL